MGVGQLQRNLLVLALLGVALAFVSASFQVAAPRPSAAGGVSAAAQVPITLYGSAGSPSTANGWGYTSAGITQPGPTIRVNQSDTITFSLFAEDSTAHILVIDFDSDGIQDTDDRASASFSSPTTAVTFTWVADRAGTFQYYCGVHGATVQRGTLVVTATAAPPAADNTLLIVGGVIVVVVVVAAAAMMMRRKPKPPMQPPTQ